MKKNWKPALLIAWLLAGAVRVLLGSSTTPIAYAFFGVFWLVSLVLLVEGIKGLVAPEGPDSRLESVFIGIAVMSVLLQGLLGAGSGSWVAALAFFVSAFVLLFLYGRRLRRGRLAHS